MSALPFYDVKGYPEQWPAEYAIPELDAFATRAAFDIPF